MSILYRVVLILIILAASYTLYGVVHFKWMYHRVENPKQDFLVLGNPDGKTTIVEFLNYSCGHCKDLHPVLKETISVRKDLRYVVRPLAYGLPEDSSVTSVKIALAAGLQGKFYEFHEAFLEYPKPDLPDDFIRELSDLYGVDYDQLISDSNGKQVKKIMDKHLAVSNHATIYSVPSIMIGKHIYQPPEEGIPDVQEMLSIIKSAEGTR